MEDWKHMVKFAIDLISHVTKIKQDNPYGVPIPLQRIMVVNLDHANELLMKAFLLKENYIIHKLSPWKIGEGLKQDATLGDVIDKDRTLDYTECAKLVSRIVNLSAEEKDRINTFHDLRNDIQHFPINLTFNKNEEISLFYPVFKSTYMKMFGNYMDEFPHLPETI